MGKDLTRLSNWERVGLLQHFGFGWEASDLGNYCKRFADKLRWVRDSSIITIMRIIMIRVEYYLFWVQLKSVSLNLIYFRDEHFWVNRLLIEYWLILYKYIILGLTSTQDSYKTHLFICLGITLFYVSSFVPSFTYLWQSGCENLSCIYAI